MCDSKIPSDEISRAVLTVFSKEELNEMAVPHRLSLLQLKEGRVNKTTNWPTKEELQEIRKLITQDLWHPSVTNLSRGSDGVRI